MSLHRIRKKRVAGAQVWVTKGCACKDLGEVGLCEQTWVTKGCAPTNVNRNRLCVHRFVW